MVIIYLRKRKITGKMTKLYFAAKMPPYLCSEPFLIFTAQHTNAGPLHPAFVCCIKERW